jgi:hypothetical protein
MIQLTGRISLLAAALTICSPCRLIWAQKPATTPVVDDSEAEVSDDDAAASNGFIGKPKLTLEVDSCQPPPAMDRRKLLQVAREHYERGEVLYVQGDYTGAVQELAASYCLVPFYSILKDLGQSYERQLDYQRAIAYLERYVAGVPADAKPLNDCAPNPQDDKKNVVARISVLAALPARITVTTNPAGADIVLVSDAGASSRGRSGGKLIESRAGRYQMNISLDGYEAQTHDVEFEVGKPYGFYFNLQKQKGRLSIVAVPDRAKIQITDKVTAIGSTNVELTAGRYEMTVTAADHKPIQQTVEVLPQREQRVVIKLVPIAETGRIESIVAFGTAGLVIGEAMGSGDGAFGGLAVGLTVGYLAIPKDMKLATSSLMISGAMAGGTAAQTAAGLGEFKSQNADYARATGVAVGGAAGYFIAERANMSPGRSALINSGVIWGSAAGGLFATSFNGTARISNGLVLTGMSVGMLSSVLIGKSFRFSRRRVVLIDVAGLVGGTVGYLAGQAAPGAVNSEDRTPNFMLAGVALGLLGGALLTRNVDALPSLPVSPVITPSSDGTSFMFGVRGAL